MTNINGHYTIKIRFVPLRTPFPLETNRLMLVKEVIPIYCVNNMERIYTVGIMQTSIKLQNMVHIVATVSEWVDRGRSNDSIFHIRAKTHQFIFTYNLTMAITHLQLKQRH
jgi:hypothetical protein